MLRPSFGVVQAQRTSSNLLEPHHYRASKVCRVLSHEFGVVRLYRTLSLYSVTGETRCAVCLGTRARWFKRSEPPRTFSNHLIAELARCVAFFHMRAVCFDCTEPSMPTSLPGKQGVQHVEPPRTSSNFIVAELARQGACSSGWFKHSEPHRSTRHTLPSLLFEKVRGGSTCLNHPKLGLKHPPHLASPVKLSLENVR